MANLSDVFKYISHFRRQGHQIGRKVGDMLEVLTYAAISYDDEIIRRLIVEPHLYGFSGAGHKVEFAIGQLDHSGIPQSDVTSLLGFIECKKVGVEQTINSTFKKNFKENFIHYNTPIRVSFNPQNIDCSACFNIMFIQSNGNPLVQIVREDNVVLQETICTNARIILCMTEDGIFHVLGNSHDLLEIQEPIRYAKILDVSNYNDSGVLAILNDCLTGPQTPEKAKQSSFVALVMNVN